MNVNDSIKNSTALQIASPQSAQPRPGAAPAKTSAATTTTKSDSVKLSAQYQALETKVADSESFNAQKVEEIKAAIASGQFQINPEKVAAGLIDTVQGLLGTRR